MSIQIHGVTALDPAQLDAMRALEERTVAADGGRLKLEWGSIESGGVKVAVLAYEQDELVSSSRAGSSLIGYVGRYQFGDGTPELAGMVDPAARRRGVGAMLLETMLAACAELGDANVLLVVPRASLDGSSLALARGVFDHSEHALSLTGGPGGAAPHPELELRPCIAGEFDRISELVEEGFGHPARPSNNPEFTHVVVKDGAIIGTIRLIPEGAHGPGVGYVGGFAITAEHRGKGYGRDILRRSVLDLRARGAESVGLEVATDNDNAVGLYASLGFRPVTTEDYYRLPTG
ncbi:MAG TPA: GNAT family N-acetyltransferase [Jatrophihabitans sp.]